MSRVAAEAAEPPLWRFVPADEVEGPPEPPGDTLRRRWARLARRLARHGRDDEARADGRAPGRHAPGRAPPPPPPPPADSEARLRSLAEALHGLGSPERVAIVDRPGTDTGATLSLLAERWRVAVLPDGASPEEALAAEGPLVLPRLERTFLRTPAGLDRLRRLLGAMLARRAPTLVGCGSWAWRYLAGAVELDLGFPRRLALAPLDAAALRRWIAGAPGAGARDEGGAWRLEGPGDPPAFFRHLAAESRGSPEVAAALWAEAVRGGPGPDADGTLVVPAWSRLRLPEPPAEAAPAELTCLQLLLLHGALDADSLADLLPFPPLSLRLRLERLAALGLVEREGNAWLATLAGYPAVRRRLAEAGLWVDDPPAAARGR